MQTLVVFLHNSVHPEVFDVLKIMGGTKESRESKSAKATMDFHMFKKLISLDNKRRYANDEQLFDWFRALDANEDGGVDQFEFKALASIVDRKDEL